MTVVILNPNAGSADETELLLEWVAARGVALLETQQAGDAHRMAAERAAAGEVVVAAGGDGTVHEVINGAAEAAGAAAVVGVLPFGTGNDLCRTLGIPLEVAGALAVLDQAEPRPIDLLRVSVGERRTLCVNVVAGGFAGSMAEALDDGAKHFWGPLAYVRGALAAFSDLHPFRVRVLTDGGARAFEALNVVVANARFAGAGLEVAPPADPADGLLDVVVVEYATLAAVTGVGARLVAGDVTTSDAVTAWRGHRVELHSEPPMAFNVDGERYGEASDLTVSVEPAALRVIAPAPEPAEGSGKGATPT